MQQHIEELKGMPEDRRQQVLDLHVSRWKEGYSILHGAGYATDPEFRTHDFNE